MQLAPLYEPSVIISLVRGAMQAINFWQNQRDRIRAKEALKEAKTNTNNKANVEEGIKLKSLIPQSTLSKMTDRVNKCFINYEDVLNDDQYLPNEIDQATNAVIACICRELRRIEKLNGGMPTTTFQEYWEKYQCKN